MPMTQIINRTLLLNVEICFELNLVHGANCKSAASLQTCSYLIWARAAVSETLECETLPGSGQRDQDANSNLPRGRRLSGVSIAAILRP